MGALIVGATIALIIVALSGAPYTIDTGARWGAHSQNAVASCLAAAKDLNAQMAEDDFGGIAICTRGDDA